jgi:hypothetical protein
LKPNHSTCPAVLSENIISQVKMEPSGIPGPVKNPHSRQRGMELTGIRNLLNPNHQSMSICCNPYIRSFTQLH